MVAPCGPCGPWASWQRPPSPSAFPDFIVFRFTQAAIWAIALLGLVLLCGVSGQFSFAQAALFGMGGYTAALVGNHTPLLGLWRARCSRRWSATPRAMASAGSPAGHSLWTQALIGYALAIAFPQLLRWRLIEHWTGGVQGLYLDLPAAAGRLPEQRPLGASCWRWRCWPPAPGWPPTSSTAAPAAR